MAWCVLNSFPEDADARLSLRGLDFFCADRLAVWRNLVVTASAGDFMIPSIGRLKNLPHDFLQKNGFGHGHNIKLKSNNRRALLSPLSPGRSLNWLGVRNVLAQVFNS